MDTSQGVIGQLFTLLWWQAPGWVLGAQRKETESLSSGSRSLPSQPCRAEGCLEMVLSVPELVQERPHALECREPD